MRKRVLVLTHELIGPLMVGPAIRAFELSARLAGIADVTLASPLPVERSHPEFRILSFFDQARLLKEMAQSHDIILVQGLILRRFPFLERLNKYLVVDLYDPFLFESYPRYLEEPDAALFSEHWGIMNHQMLVGDYFLCASERQRDMWLGRFCALGRLSPALYAKDPSFRALIGVVPFGLPETPPSSSEARLKGIRPGIEKNDFLLLWGGGVWDWFDPLTVIRAVAEVAKTHDQVKFFFMGTGRQKTRMLGEAIRLSEELGVLEKSVFFNEEWVPYDERQHYLLEADAGVSSHFDAIETRFSFRTRVLDYLWAGLPILTTEGDGMADLVEKKKLGTVLPAQDVAAWRDAILSLVDRREKEKISARVREANADFVWSEAAKPLLAYCQAPYRTPRDLPKSFELSKGFRILREGGILALTKKVFSRLARAGGR